MNILPQIRITTFKLIFIYSPGEIQDWAKEDLEEYETPEENLPLKEIQEEVYEEDEEHPNGKKDGAPVKFH